jgi:biotin carboxyl carrier protein
MKYRLRVEGVWFVVEVGDLSARPVIAIVDGDPVEVWPEEPVGLPLRQEKEEHTTKPNTVTLPAGGGKTSSSPGAAPPPPAEANGLNLVRAPIPGVVISIAVQPGEQVVPGQELCVLEAMKMKNSIRAARAGQIGAVRVIPGQHVKHRDVLMEYTR